MPLYVPLLPMLLRWPMPQSWAPAAGPLVVLEPPPLIYAVLGTTIITRPAC